MMQSKTWVIGDVHGCLDELHALVDKIQPTSGDRVIFLGDLIDKGPYALDTLRLIQSKGWESLLGNHEEKHSRYRSRMLSGNENHVQLYEETEYHSRYSAQDIEWMRSLPTFIRVGNTVLVHGGMIPGVPVNRQHPKACLRIRVVDKENRQVSKLMDNFHLPEGFSHWSDRWTGPESVIYGHDPISLSSPKVNRFSGYSCYGLDTGCVYGGRLTALHLETGAFVQVQSKHAYATSKFEIPC